MEILDINLLGLEVEIVQSPLHPVLFMFANLSIKPIRHLKINGVEKEF